MATLASARFILHPGRRFHDGHPPKRRSLAPVCLFGVCDPVNAERVYRQEMDKEQQRLAEMYEVLVKSTPLSRVQAEDERNPLIEVVGDADRRGTTPVTVEGEKRIERTPTTDGGVVRGGKVTKRRQIKLTDLWTKVKLGRPAIVDSDLKKRPNAVNQTSTSRC